jgi:hypothetical protein
MGYRQTRTCNSRYLPKLDWKTFRDTQTLVLSCAMGGGKSHVTAQLLEEILGSVAIRRQLGLPIDAEKVRILFVACRVSFGLNLLQRFERLGMVVYSDPDVSFGYWTPGRLVIEFESLWRLVEGEAYHICVVDECVSLLDNVRARLASGMWAANNRMLRSMLQLSRINVAADAYLTAQCYEFLARLSNDRILLLKNEYRPVRRKVYYVDVENFVKELLVRVTRGERVMLATSTVSFGHRVLMAAKAARSGIKYRFYHARAKEEEMTELRGDLDLVWRTLDLLIFSASITVGLDSHAGFDHTFVYAGVSGLDALSSTQMSGRVRNVRSDTIHIHVAKQYQSTDYVPPKPDHETLHWIAAADSDLFKCVQDRPVANMSLVKQFMHVDAFAGVSAETYECL